MSSSYAQVRKDASSALGGLIAALGFVLARRRRG